MNVTHLGLVLDCSDPESLAEFWGPALGYVKAGAAGNFVALRPDDTPGPKLLLQRIPESKTVKNRMHLDIEVADMSRSLVTSTSSRTELVRSTRG